MFDAREENFDSGRPISTFQFIELGHGDLLPIKGPYAINEISRFRHIHRIFFQHLTKWQELRSADGFVRVLPDRTYFDGRSRPSTLLVRDPHELHFLSESLIIHMRRFLESHLMLVQIMRHRIIEGDPHSFPKSISTDDLGALLEPKKNNDFLLACFGISNDCASRTKDFLELLRRLGNAIKHHAPFSDAYNLIGSDFPTIVGIETPWQDIGEAVFHNHSSHQIMMGFQDSATTVLSATREQLQKISSEA